MIFLFLEILTEMAPWMLLCCVRRQASGISKIAFHREIILFPERFLPWLGIMMPMAIPGSALMRHSNTRMYDDFRTGAVLISERMFAGEY